MLRNALALCSGVALAAAGATQSPLYTDQGIGSVDKFGYSIRSAGDVNADGRTDFIYSAPFLEANGLNNAGLVRVRSGADGSLLYEFPGDEPGDEWGYQVEGVGDVDADGHDDFLITELIAVSRYDGAAHVYSGADGSIIHSFFGERSYDYFGVSGAGAGDFDADGYPDIVIGVPGRDDNGTSAGEVNVYSGRTGAVLFSRDGVATGDQLGWYVSTAGDVDNDGFDDIVVGSPTHDGANGGDCGRADVISGRTHAVLYTWYGDGYGDRFGWCVSNAGDLDRDGHDDVVVGAHGNNNAHGTDAGMVRVFSGATGAVLFTFLGDAAGDNLGWSVRNAGDVNGDGWLDVMAGAHLNDHNGSNAGMARIWSGRDGSILHTLYGTDADDWFGWSVGDVGDLDADGYCDVAVGATYDDSVGTDAGKIFVYSFGGVGTPPIYEHRGSPCLTSAGTLPRLEVAGHAAIGDTAFFGLRGGPANCTALLNFGAALEIPLDAAGAPGCRGYADPGGFVIPTTSNANGLADVALAIPPIAGLVGMRLDFQWIAQDPAANALGFVFSDATGITFGN